MDWQLNFDYLNSFDCQITAVQQDIETSASWNSVN